jgi:hypothetical protein
LLLPPPLLHVLGGWQPLLPPLSCTTNNRQTATKHLERGLQITLMVLLVLLGRSQVPPGQQPPGCQIPNNGQCATPSSVCHARTFWPLHDAPTSYAAAVAAVAAVAALLHSTATALPEYPM